MALSNSQFNAILREYERLQSENRSALQKRRKIVYERIPELKELEDQAALSAVRRLKRAVRSGDGGAVSGFSEEVAAIGRRRTELLLAAGFAADELEPRYHCPHCRDTGFIDGRKCRCFHSRAVKLLYAQSGLDKIPEHERFENFSPEWYDDVRILPSVGVTERAWMKKIEARCRQYAGEFGERRESLLFQGNTGVGKTFLSNSIARELIAKGFAVVRLTALELFDCLAGVRIERTENPALRELYEYVFSCDLLVLDDLGTELTNAFSASQLFYLVDARLKQRKGTIISTNLSLQGLRDAYSDRTTSRITSGYDILMLYGGDIRAKKRMKEMGM